MVSSTGLARELRAKIRSSGCKFQVRSKLGYIMAIHVKDKEQKGLKLAWITTIGCRYEERFISKQIAYHKEKVGSGKSDNNKKMTISFKTT